MIVEGFFTSCKIKSGTAKKSPAVRRDVDQILSQQQNLRTHSGRYCSSTYTQSSVCRGSSEFKPSRDLTELTEPLLWISDGRPRFSWRKKNGPTCDFNEEVNEKTKQTRDINL